eukprot:TRINITY_DN12848_c0_g1_i16.p1 TRINITY_DN12848_c0_g1~~TRINITY_DN12848_c0_g1_i16.p1  ORF type:complete len:138 (-),score=15.05 TRINITY_DN12848_c0_g1_i16:86-499(-)
MATLESTFDSLEEVSWCVVDCIDDVCDDCDDVASNSRCNVCRRGSRVMEGCSSRTSSLVRNSRRNCRPVNPSHAALAVTCQRFTNSSNSLNEIPLSTSVEEDVVGVDAVSYTHLRAHETPEHLVCRLLLEKKKKKKK